MRKSMHRFNNSGAFAPLCSIISKIVTLVHREAMYCTCGVTLWHFQVNTVALEKQQ